MYDNETEPQCAEDVLRLWVARAQRGTAYKHGLAASMTAHNKLARKNKALQRLGRIASIPGMQSHTANTPRASSEQLDAWLTHCVIGDHKDSRLRARRWLTRAIEADGHSPASARIITDRLIAERRREITKVIPRISSI